jgi:hypothetical protein
MRIREIAQAKRFKTKKPDNDWRERLKEKGLSDDTAHPDPRAERLKALMLPLGGWAVGVDLLDNDLEKIISRGQVWSGRGALFMKGRPSDCHGNTAALYEANMDRVQICTGYALSDDGFWRQHSWGFCNNKPVETTVARVAYFGVILTPDEAEQFCYDNS